jgi:translation initiation factor IF-3
VAERSKFELRVNDQIRVPQVRLIDQNGAQIGIVPVERAREMAQERGLDLVEIAPNANPPVCRMMDYGKFKYDQKKRTRAARRTAGQVKEVRLRPLTGAHDLETKVERAKGFLEEGYKVLVTVVFRGREITRQEIGQEQMDRMAKALEDVAKVERPPRLEGTRMSMVLSPKPAAKKKGGEGGQAKDAQRGGQEVQGDGARQGALPAGGKEPPAVVEKREAPPQPS